MCLSLHTSRLHTKSEVLWCTASSGQFCPTLSCFQLPFPSSGEEFSSWGHSPCRGHSVSVWIMHSVLTPLRPVTFPFTPQLGPFQTLPHIYLRIGTSCPSSLFALAPRTVLYPKFTEPTRASLVSSSLLSPLRSHGLRGDSQHPLLIGTTRAAFETLPMPRPHPEPIKSDSLETSWVIPRAPSWN